LQNNDYRLLTPIVGSAGFYSFASTPTFADVSISFAEVTSNGRFTFLSAGNCTIKAATVPLIFLVQKLMDAEIIKKFNPNKVYPY